jgi:hypothetical protein
MRSRTSPSSSETLIERAITMPLLPGVKIREAWEISPGYSALLD